MVAHVLRLRAALLIGALRGERKIRTLIALALVVGITVVVCWAILSLLGAPLPVARTVIVLGGAVVFLGFLLGPILVGTADQLDPRRFAVFGVDEKKMPWVVGIASLVSVPTFALAAVNICACIVAIELGAPWPLAVPMSVVGLLTTVLAARIGMAVNALLLPERRSRELTVLFALAIVIIGFPVGIFLASLGWAGQVPGAVDTATTVIGFTPFASSSGFLFASASADVAGMWITALVTLVTAAALWLVWSLLVKLLLVTTGRPVSSRERTGLGWFALLPSNAFGAIAARSLVYWLRDRRYVVNILVVPVAAVLTVLPLMVAGVPIEIAALVPVPVMALFFGWLPHNDLAYDSTAFWTHVASGVRGVFDRLGRLVPITLVAAPVMAIAISLTLATTSAWHLLLPFIGVTLSLFLSALGFSSIVSAAMPYAVSRPGDSPFQQPQRASSRNSFGPAIAFLGALVVSAPSMWFFLRILTEGADNSALTFWTGIGTGVVVLVIGVFIGGRIFDRSGERLMEFVETT